MVLTTRFLIAPLHPIRKDRVLARRLLLLADRAHGLLCLFDKGGEFLQYLAPTQKYCSLAAIGTDGPANHWYQPGVVARDRRSSCLLALDATFAALGFLPGSLAYD